MLEKLQKRIEKEGYICYLNSENTLVCGTDNGWSDLLDCQLLKSTYSIRLENEIFILDYTRAQLIEIKKFEDIRKLIFFIKKIKPIDTK